MGVEMTQDRTRLDEKLMVGYQHREHSAALTL